VSVGEGEGRRGRRPWSGRGGHDRGRLSKVTLKVSSRSVLRGMNYCLKNGAQGNDGNSGSATLKTRFFRGNVTDKLEGLRGRVWSGCGLRLSSVIGLLKSHSTRPFDCTYAPLKHKVSETRGLSWTSNPPQGIVLLNRNGSQKRPRGPEKKRAMLLKWGLGGTSRATHLNKVGSEQTK